MDLTDSFDVHPDERFGNVLADFMDWCDQAGDAPDVDRYLMARASQGDKSEFDDSALISKLREFAADLRSLRPQAAAAVTQWIDEETTIDLRQDEPSLPRDFGEYELLERIGQGGMGLVYRARQKQPSRIVCVKMLPPGMIATQHSHRFQVESELAGKLHHPGVVPVFAAGQHQGQPFYVMEYIEGTNLRQWLSENDPSPEAAAEAVREIAIAVDYAHQCGVLHRDLKPSNVMIDSRNRFRITDFGLARDLDASATDGGVAGTPAYMAPEQIRGESLGPETDVYGLGALLYEMLTRQATHSGRTAADTLWASRYDAPRSATTLRPGLPTDLATICHRCLSERPESRYRSARQLAEELTRYLRSEPILARPISRFERMKLWVRRHPATSSAMAIGALSLVTVLLIGTFALWKTNAALRQAARSLYLARISQVATLLGSGQVADARQTLRTIASEAAFKERMPIEYRMLHSRAFPETRLVHVDGPPITDVQWLSGSGRTRLLTLHIDGSVSLVAADSNAIVFRNDSTDAICLAVSADGESILAGDREKRLVFLDPKTMQPADFLCQLQATPTKICWPDGQRLVWVSTQDGALLRIDLQTGVAETMLDPQTHVTCFDLDSLGRTIVAADQSRNVFVIAADDRFERVDLARVDHWIVDVAWSNQPESDNGEFAVLDEQGEVAVWRIEYDQSPATLRRVRSLPTGNVGAACLIWPKSDLLIANRSGGITVWAPTAQVPAVTQPTMPIHSIAVDSAGKRLAMVHQAESMISIWERSVQRDVNPRLTSQIGIQPTIEQQTSPSRSVACDALGTVSVWRDVEGFVTIHHPDSKPTRIKEGAIGASALALDRLGLHLAVTSEQNEVVVYQLPSLDVLARVSDHARTVWSLAFSSDGEWLASGDDAGAIVITPIAAPDSRVTVQTKLSEVRDLDFSPNNDRLLALGGTEQFLVYGLASGEASYQTPSSQRLQTGRFVSEQTVLVGDQAGFLQYVDLTNPARKQRWKAHKGSIWDIALHADRAITCGQDGHIRIWGIDGTGYPDVIQLSSPVWSLALSGSGNVFYASTTDGRQYRWVW